MKVNLLVFLIVSLIIALISSITFSIGYFQIYTDEGYVDFLEEKTGYDYDKEEVGFFGLMAMGNFFFGFIMLIGHILVHTVLLIFTFTRLKNSKINLREVIIQRNETFPNIIRILGYLMIINFVRKYLTNFYKFNVYNFVFYISTVLLVLSYVLWIISIHKAKKYA